MTHSSLDWETDESGASDTQLPLRAGVKTLPLLPVPGDVARQGDKLCNICEALSLDVKRFVVLPGDKEWQQPNQADELNISLGNVEDMARKTNCPLCRLV